MTLAATILSIVLAVFYLVAGSPKVMKSKSSLETRDKLHVDSTLWSIIGVLEGVAAIALIIGIWIPPLGIAAATGLTLLMIGALITHLRANDTKGALAVIPFIILTAATVTLIALTLYH
jgi:uncharacterized membrane protein YphA (DoxX/SURF4 family)